MKKILFVISSEPVLSRVEGAERSRFLHFGRNDLFIFFGLLVYWYTGIISPIHAQSTTLSVSPPVVEILLAPNKKVTQTFTLQTTGENLEVTPELHLAKPSDSSGHMTIDPAPLNPASLPLIFTIDQAGPVYTLTLEAANTDMAQDVYLALVFRASPSPYSIPNTAYSIPAISALILVTLTGEGFIPIDLELNNFDPPFLHDSWLPLILVPSLKNKSGVMIRPQGLYEIISPSGKTLLSLPLYPNLVLGNSSRSIVGSHTRCEGSPHTGCVDLDPLPLSWSPHWSNLGPHRLRLTITTEGGTQLTQLEKVIWLLPIRLIVFITVITAIIIVLLTSLYKHSKFNTV